MHFLAMNTQIKKKVESKFVKDRPDIRVGDVVRLHMRISEGDKSRIQYFEGIVISLKGAGLNKMITVRKISNGIGVERIVPLHAPNLEGVDILKRGKVRRSKLYYIRDRVGKAATRIKNLKEFVAPRKTDEDVEDNSSTVAHEVQGESAEPVTDTQTEAKDDNGAADDTAKSAEVEGSKEGDASSDTEDDKKE